MEDSIIIGPNQSLLHTVFFLPRLSIYSAESMGDGTKKCLATVKFDDAVTSMW